MPRLRDSQARPYVRAHEIPANSLLYICEDVKPGLEEGVEAVRDFDGLVELVVGRVNSVFEGLRAADGEVAVELDHGPLGRHRFRRVDLDLVIALGAGAGH